MAGVLLCGVALVAGCGGSAHPAGSTPRTAHGPRTSLTVSRPAAARAPGLLGNAPSAGGAQSYVATGRIVVDSGFRPATDGFAFENYGNDAGPVNLTPANVDDLFGDQVCQTGGGNNCVLSPSARHWMDQVNASMANGHCMGFSVSALRFFAGNLNPRDYGATTTTACRSRATGGCSP